MATNNNDKTLNVPPLRFPEFSGEWEEEQLDSIATLSKGIGISKEQLSEDALSSYLGFFLQDGTYLDIANMTTGTYYGFTKE